MRWLSNEHGIGRRRFWRAVKTSVRQRRGSGESGRRSWAGLIVKIRTCIDGLRNGRLRDRLKNVQRQRNTHGRWCIENGVTDPAERTGRRMHFARSRSGRLGLFAPHAGADFLQGRGKRILRRAAGSSGNTHQNRMEDHRVSREAYDAPARDGFPERHATPAAESIGGARERKDYRMPQSVAIRSALPASAVP